MRSAKLPTISPLVLTARETEILIEIALGRNTSQIAERLHISKSTIKNTVHNIYSKLGLHKRVDLILYAVDHKMVSLDDATVSMDDSTVTDLSASTVSAFTVISIDHRRELYDALKEVVCWLQRGQTAQEAGAQCETLSQALRQSNAAIRRYEEDVSAQVQAQNAARASREREKVMAMTSGPLRRQEEI